MLNRKWSLVEVMWHLFEQRIQGITRHLIFSLHFQSQKRLSPVFFLSQNWLNSLAPKNLAKSHFFKMHSAHCVIQLSKSAGLSRYKLYQNLTYQNFSHFYLIECSFRHKSFLCRRLQKIQYDNLQIVLFWSIQRKKKVQFEVFST